LSYNRFFSVDSPKAVKANEFGWLNAINYMAPAATAGQGNMCPHASPGCLALCLGWYSGQAAMLANDKLETGNNAARASRARKVVKFMHDRKAFLVDMVKGLQAAQRKADRLGFKLCTRLNGATDITWESMRADGANMFDAFPAIQFVDYTKNFRRMLRFCEGKLPANYHLTFSRSEMNEAECLTVLEKGGNVAVVFAGEKPSKYLGRTVVDGDIHDLRHLDPKGGFIIGLSPKGRKAKADTSGFVVRL
jgi:hypothetical protein